MGRWKIFSFFCLLESSHGIYAQQRYWISVFETNCGQRAVLLIWAIAYPVFLHCVIRNPERCSQRQLSLFHSQLSAILPRAINVAPSKFRKNGENPFAPRRRERWWIVRDATENVINLTNDPAERTGLFSGRRRAPSLLATDCSTNLLKLVQVLDEFNLRRYKYGKA